MNIKTYLPMKDKAILVQLIMENSFDKETKRFNYVQMQMCYELLLVKFYADIEFEEKGMYELYDDLKSDGTIDGVVAGISHAETDVIKDCLDRQIEQEQKFALSYIDEFRGFLGKVIEKLPDEKEVRKLSKQLIKDFKKLDPSKLQFVQDFIKANNPQ